METRHVDSNREGAESMTEQDAAEMRRRVRSILNVLAFAHVRAEDMGNQLRRSKMLRWKWRC